MAALSLTQAQTALNNWIAADAAVAGGQTYMIGTRRLERVHAQEIRNNICFWVDMVNRLSRGSNAGMRVRYGVVPTVSSDPANAGLNSGIGYP